MGGKRSGFLGEKETYFFWGSREWNVNENVVKISVEIREPDLSKLCNILGLSNACI